MAEQEDGVALDLQEEGACQGADNLPLEVQRAKSLSQILDLAIDERNSVNFSFLKK